MSKSLLRHQQLIQRNIGFLAFWLCPSVPFPEENPAKMAELFLRIILLCLWNPLAWALKMQCEVPNLD